MLGEEHPDTLTFMNNLASTYQAQGDLARARDLQERVLGNRCRALGDENSNTTITAWNLLQTLRNLGESDAAQEVVEKFLLFLVERNPAFLSADQRRIRDMLLRMIQPLQDPTDAGGQQVH